MFIETAQGLVGKGQICAAVGKYVGRCMIPWWETEVVEAVSAERKSIVVEVVVKGLLIYRVSERRGSFWPPKLRHEAEAALAPLTFGGVTDLRKGELRIRGRRARPRRAAACEPEINAVHEHNFATNDEKEMKTRRDSSRKMLFSSSGLFFVA